jgi:ATP/maltotriose-dependent transcriptional regulator MalT
LIGFNFLKSKRKKDLPSYKVDESVRKKLNLNDREFQVLELIAMGKTNKEIADTLFLALPTIKTHTSNLYGKLEVRNRTEAVIKARNLRLIK